MIQLPNDDGEEDARTKRRGQNCGEIKAHSDEFGFNCFDKFLSRCVETSGDTQSIHRKTWREGKKKFKTRLSVEISSEAERCIFWRVDGGSNAETCRNREKLGIMGIFWILITERPRE